MPADLDAPAGRRTRDLTDTLTATLNADLLWDECGIDNDVVVGTIYIQFEKVNLIS